MTMKNCHNYTNMEIQSALNIIGNARGITFTMQRESDLPTNNVVIQSYKGPILVATTTCGPDTFKVEATEWIKNMIIDKADQYIIDELPSNIVYNGINVQFLNEHNERLRALLNIIDSTCGDEQCIYIKINYTNYKVSKCRGCPLFAGLIIHHK